MLWIRAQVAAAREYEDYRAALNKEILGIVKVYADMVRYQGHPATSAMEALKQKLDAFIDSVSTDLQTLKGELSANGGKAINEFSAEFGTPPTEGTPRGASKESDDTAKRERAWVHEIYPNIDTGLAESKPIEDVATEIVTLASDISKELHAGVDQLKKDAASLLAMSEKQQKGTQELSEAGKPITPVWTGALDASLDLLGAIPARLAKLSQLSTIYAQVNPYQSVTNTITDFIGGLKTAIEEGHISGAHIADYLFTAINALDALANKFDGITPPTKSVTAKPQVLAPLPTGVAPMFSKPEPGQSPKVAPQTLDVMHQPYALGQGLLGDLQTIVAEPSLEELSTEADWLSTHKPGEEALRWQQIQKERDRIKRERETAVIKKKLEKGEAKREIKEGQRPKVQPGITRKQDEAIPSGVKYKTLDTDVNV